LVSINGKEYVYCALRNEFLMQFIEGIKRWSTQLYVVFSATIHDKPYERLHTIVFPEE
jgi:hypothetical protein